MRLGPAAAVLVMAASAAAASSPAAWFNGPVPPSCAGVRDQVEAFVQRHLGPGGASRRIVLVTSGGTTVPLEKNTVRFIDNFSTGSRGSKSVECFLEDKYAVIFMHRKGSMEPFSLLKELLTKDILSSRATRKCEGGGYISEASLSDADAVVADRLMKIYRQCVEEEQCLLAVPFTSVDEYLHSLKAACEALQTAGQRAMVYLAAAVSDYFVPAEEMAEHKIQSSSGDLELSLRPTPKCLSLLKQSWCPQALIVSFKLETDEAILMSKATGAISKYGVDCVIANLLHTRNSEVQVVARRQHLPGDALSSAQGVDGVDGEFEKVTVTVEGKGQVERPLIQTMVRIHQAFVSASAAAS